MIENMDLPDYQKIELDGNLKEEMETFYRNENVTEKYRFNSRWVQSNPFTDKIGHNFRMKETMLESINRTTAGWANESRKKRQATNNQAIQDLINFIGESCENGEDVFEGSFTGEGVECDPSDEKDVYRRFDGVCNNLIDKNYGAAGTAMRRFVEPAYADGKYCFIYSHFVCHVI